MDLAEITYDIRNDSYLCLSCQSYDCIHVQEFTGRRNIKGIYSPVKYENSLQNILANSLATSIDSVIVKSASNYQKSNKLLLLLR